MEETIKQFMDMMKEMKQGQDAIKEEMKQGHDAIKEIKQCQDEMKSEVTRQLQDQGNKMDQQVSEILTNLKTEMHTRFDASHKKSGTVKVEEDYRHSSKIKPPTYDGKTSWQTYMKQFEAAANVNNWSESEKATALVVSLRGDALEILQTLNEDQHKNYEDLVLQLEMRFGDKHLQQVYQAQLKGRNQRINENLQQYEADIARLVYLAYPTAPRDFIEQLAVQVFIDGIRDCETQQALRLARCKKLNEVLAYALEFEAAKQASRGHTRIRQIRTRTPEREYRSNNTYTRSNFKDDVENLRQNIKRYTDWNKRTEETRQPVLDERFHWSAGTAVKKGHIRPRCPRLGSEQAPVQRQVEDQENAN
ncbi:hypothetical protein NQ317_005297 [Molorchus minor]|uniref:Paraneoplastic antigen Ma-like C-terminal domain-containing protein n=1 Tax=Molorchus minor TaxID=1323400 RepID=A0ABQ9JNI9_9CUCU|nr:hypothetical protein NQ317_005297 [Molorchus minor]